MVSKFKITNHNVAYLVNTKEDVVASGLDVFSISRGMVNVMAGIKELIYGLILLKTQVVKRLLELGQMDKY